MRHEISAIIVEDAKRQQTSTEFILKELAPNVRIIGNTTRLSEAVKMIGRLHPLLLILNIREESEIKTAKELLIRNTVSEGFKFQTIILCAPEEEEQYSEANNSGSVHFLPKQFDKETLKEKIDCISESVLLHKLDQLVSMVSQMNDVGHKSALPDWIVVEGVYFTEFINPKDIVYLEASGRYTYFHMNIVGSQPICSSVNLGEYEKKLKNNTRFFRIHRNKIVNLDFLLRFSKKDRVVVLSPPYGNQIASKERFSEMLTHLEHMKYQE